MADDPWGQFVPKPADPWAQFTPEAATPSLTQPAPSGQALGARALWDKPASASWGDYLLAHLAQPFQGIGQATKDYARAGFDAGTFGFGNDIQAAISGNTPEQERAATQAAHQRLGPMDYAASAIGYAPTGELGAASWLGGKVAPYLGRWAGGVLGSAAEGAGAGALGAAGHGDDIGPSALIGGALGAAAGVPGGVVGRSGKLAPAVSEDALRARATQEYAPLDAIVFHGPGQVKPALDAVTDTMTQAEKDLAASTMAKVNKLAGTDLPTGSDIQSYQKILGGLSKTGSDMDREFAPKFKSALEDVMQNVDPYGRNLTPGQSMSLMPGGSLGGTGFAAGDATAARNAGDVFHGRAQDVARLDDPHTGWVAQSKVAGGPDVSSQARSYLLSKEGQRFAPSGSPQYDAYNAIAKTTAPSAWSPTTWDVKHHLLWPIAGLAVGQGIGALGTAEGAHPWYAMPAEDVAGLLAGLTLRGGSGALRNQAIQRATQAARSAVSTGKVQAPVLPDAAFRDAVRRIIYGQGAAGAY